MCVQGYVLLAKLDGSKSTWNYDSSLWTGLATTQNVNSFSLDRTEAKLEAFNYFPITTVRIGLSLLVGGDISVRWLDLPLGTTYTSLSSLMASGTFVPTRAGRQSWRDLVGSSASMQANCNQEGFNNYPSGWTNHYHVRIGILANGQNDCGTPDTAIGLGMNQYCAAGPGAVGNGLCDVVGDDGPGQVWMFGYILAK